MSGKSDVIHNERHSAELVIISAEQYCFSVRDVVAMFDSDWMQLAGTEQISEV
jgi:hypothetical protein